MPAEDDLGALPPDLLLLSAFPFEILRSWRKVAEFENNWFWHSLKLSDGSEA